MIRNGAIPRSWREAAAYAQTPMSSLRAAIKRGDVPAPTTGPDGRSVWDLGALDALRAARGQVALSGASPLSIVTTTVSNVSSPSQSSVVPIADFLLAASSAHTDSGDEANEDDDGAGHASHQPPFWMTGTGVEPAYPSGVPHVDPTTLRIFYTPEAVTATHAAGSVGASVQQLQAEVVELRAQLTATTTAWRRDRMAAIAAEIAVEALMSGTLPQVAMAARDAAHASAAALTDDELRREDGYASAVARGAGIAEAQRLGAVLAWQTQQAPWPLPPSREPHDEIARARARRRSRSPRW